MHPVLKTVLQRLGLGLLTLFVVSVLIFASLEMLPGGFAQAILGQGATPETVAAFNHQLGLDRPATVRYFEWIWNVLHGDFGYSYAGAGGSIKQSVSGIIAPRLYNTFFLAIMTAIIAVPLALFLGIMAALYRNSLYDRAVNAVTLTTIATPEFFIAYLLMFFFAIKLKWFPSLSTVSDSTSIGEHMYRAALPAITLTLVIVAHMMRMTRAALINLLASPYMEMARLKGVSQRDAIVQHALPNAWAPIATVVAFNLAYLVVGVVVVEVVFVYPGIGQLMVDSVSSRNMPVVQACALIFAATYILLNLSADIVSIITNPRLLHPK
ncbi:ABC transporter permease [Aestuariivirga litoralis]|uniref:ABC transporter permease n=1 Tax=Aestuariivirga litoralis TaxID=2650924 RepID=A0A2W2AST5_9HYPH|nr:ABC transporter permease [Aestuariivirga litoralis]PZF76712.1 ABC transporter permease [Aestuariivirga litoralis]